MDPTEAGAVLGVDRDADSDTVRAAHRQAIRRTHPDAGGSTFAAARVNEALEVLQRTAPAVARHESPAEATPPTEAPVDPRPDDVDRFFVVADDPRSLLSRLAEAGHDVGEVVFVDSHAGILEIVVGDPPRVGQLAVMVGEEEAGGTPVSFTLEPLGVDPAPPIDSVVGALMAAITKP